MTRINAVLPEQEKLCLNMPGNLSFNYGRILTTSRYYKVDRIVACPNQIFFNRKRAQLYKNLLTLTHGRGEQSLARLDSFLFRQPREIRFQTILM